MLRHFVKAGKNEKQQSGNVEYGQSGKYEQMPYLWINLILASRRGFIAPSMTRLLSPAPPGSMLFLEFSLQDVRSVSACW